MPQYWYGGVVCDGVALDGVNRWRGHASRDYGVELVFRVGNLRGGVHVEQ